MRFVVIFFFFGGCILSQRAFSQIFDSVHVYALSMNASYHVTMDKNIIKNETDLISIKETCIVSGIDKALLDTIKGLYVKKIKSNNLDSRLVFEFFNKGIVSKVVGVTSYGTMFIDYKLYKYDKAKLKYLNKYIPGLTNTLGIKK